MKKRILSLALTICMVLSLMPITAFGESGKHTVTVNAGENGKVSTDGTSWSDSVEVTVNDGETLNGKVQYKADEGYGIDGVVPKIVSVAAGGSHNVLLDTNGNVWTAGSNFGGQLGRDEKVGTWNANSTFKRVTVGDGVKIKAMAAGGHTVLLDANGNVWTAGGNYYGQLGKDGGNTSTFTQVTVGNGVKIEAIVAGSNHTVLLDANGNVWTAGWNSYGQLGIGKEDDNANSTFKQVTVGDGVKIKAIAADGVYTVLLDEDGNVWTAGRNNNGQLGRDENTGTDNANPTFKRVSVGDGVKIKAIAAGDSHTVLLDENGNVWTAGSNSYGQLGRTANNSPNPTFTQVTNGISGVKITAITAGDNHTVLLDKDGNVWSAGGNIYGQLGRDEKVGTWNATPTFSQVTVSDGVKIKAIAANTDHTVLLDEYGNVWTAGKNTYGQLGREENIDTYNANPTFKQPTVNPDAAITFKELLNTPIYNDSEFIVKFKVKYETVYLRTTDGGLEWSFQSDFPQAYSIDSTTIDFRDFSNSVFMQNGWSLDWGFPEIYVQSGDWTLLPATDSKINCSIDGGSLTVQYENGQTYPGGCANVSDGATLNIQGDGISESWEISTLRVTGIYAGTVRFISGTVIHAHADYLINVYILGGNINFIALEGQVVKNGDGTTVYPRGYYFYNPDSDKVISISTPEGTIVCEDEYYYPIHASYDYNKNYMHVWSVNDFDIYYATAEKADGEQYRLLRVSGGKGELQKSVPFYGLDTNPNYRFYRTPDESVTLTAGKINVYENWVTIDDPHIIGTLTELGSNMSAEWSYQNEKGEKVVVGGNSLTCTIDDLSDIVNYRTYTCKVYVEDAGGKKEEIGSYSAKVYVMRWEQPEPIYSAPGKEVTFTANPSEETEWAAGFLSTLKWQVNKGTGWEDIPNSNTDSYTVTITEENAGYKYRRVINGYLIGNFDKHESNIYIEFTSPELSVTLVPEITSQPQGIRIQENDTAKHELSVSANNAESYRWQKKVDDTFVDIEGATSSTLEVGVEDVGTYRCVVSNRFGETVSEEANVGTGVAPSCDTLSGVNVTLGAKAQFGVGINNAPGDGSVSVKWQYSADDGATWVDVVSPDDRENISMNVLEMVFSQIWSDGTVIKRYEILSSSMTINKTTADMDGWKVRCVLTDAVGVYYSNTVELSIEMPDYTVTFNTDGGTEIASKTTVQWTDTVLDGVSEPTKDGWKFIGWKYGDVPVTPKTTYKDLAADATVLSIELKAQWEDIAAPTGEISIGEDSWKAFLNKITFGLFFKDTKTVTITASDNSGEAVTVSYLLSDTAIAEDKLAEKEFITYTDGFDIEPNNEWIIYAKLTDKAGNVRYLSSDGIVLDNVAPVISGVENGKTYCEAQIVTVDEKYIDSVTVNGTKVSLDTNGQFTLNPAEGTQTIVVTDKAGNVSAEITVTVNDGHTDINKDNKCDFCDATLDSDTEVDTDSITDSDTEVDTDSITGSDTEVDTDSATDSDTEVDTDSTTDSDTEVDTDSTTDSDTEGDTDSTTDSDTEVDSDSTTESDTEVDTDSTTDSDTEVDTDSATDSDTEVDTDSATDSDTEVDTDSITDSDTEVDTDSATDSDTEVDTDSATDGDTEVDTDSATDSDTEVDTDSSTDSDTENDTDSTTDGDTEVDTDSTTDSDTEVDTDSATDSDTEVDTDSASDSDTEVDTDSATDSDTEVDTDSATDGDTEGDTDSATDGDTEVDTDSATDSDTEVDTDSATDSDTEVDTDSASDSDTEVDTDSSTDSDTDDPKDTPDEPIKALVGDVNGDGRISAFDSFILQRYIAGVIELTDYQHILGDVTGDGKIAAKDYVDIQRYSVKGISNYKTGEIVEFPAERIK